MKSLQCTVLFLGVLAGAGLSATGMAKSPSKEEVLARQSLILDHPPRIEPLQPDQYGEEAQQTVAEIRQAIGAPPSAVMPEYFATMLRHPELMKRQIEFSIQLFNGALSPRDRELAILRVAWLCQAPYEWGEHVQAAKRQAGITSEEIERVTAGSAAPGWSDRDRALLRAVEELLDDAMISDATWGALKREFDEQQLLELPLLVGTYQGVAYQQNSVRFRLADDNEGLTAR